MTTARIDAPALIRQLDPLARRSGGQGAVVFDADGTLWTYDVGINTFIDALELDLLREAARTALLQEVEKHGLADSSSLHADANALGRILERAFEEDRYAEKAATEMQVWAYAGWSEDELRAHARQSLERHGHSAHLYRPLLPVVQWARDAGLRTVIVSASPQIVVEEAAASLGFSARDIIAGRPKQNSSGFLPELTEPLPYGKDKVSAARRLIGDAAWLATFGDSAFDVDMLAEAHLPVAVRPKDELLERLPRLASAVRFVES